MPEYALAQKKIMERRFNIVDHKKHTAHTTLNYFVQVHDYV
ncbi:hypothetical protein [Enterobacter hormaechei]|nr:hypothetical protein [Enterobacter hormaechei]